MFCQHFRKEITKRTFICKAIFLPVIIIQVIVANPGNGKNVRYRNFKILIFISIPKYEY